MISSRSLPVSEPLYDRETTSAHTFVQVLIDFGFAEQYDETEKNAFMSNLHYGTPEVCAHSISFSCLLTDGCLVHLARAGGRRLTRHSKVGCLVPRHHIFRDPSGSYTL